MKEGKRAVTYCCIAQGSKRKALVLQTDEGALQKKKKKAEAALSVDLWTVLTGNAENAKTLMGFMLPLQFLSLLK